MASQDDYTMWEFNSSDGTSAAYAQLLYNPVTGGPSGYLICDYNGVRLWGSVTAVTPPSTNSRSLPAAAETWHNIGMGSSGLSGTLRIKLLAEQKFALIHAAITFTYTGSIQTFNLGSLPSAPYYPQAGQSYPVSVNATPSGVGASLPRLYVPTSGAVQLIVPSGSGAGAVAGGTVVIPLD